MKEVGYISYKHQGRFIDYKLFEIEYEMEMKCPMTEDEYFQDTRFFRIQSDRMKEVGMASIVKINCKKELVYFLAQPSVSGETDRVLFESKGVKLTCLKVEED